MEKDCCQVKVTQLDDGYRIEITGEKVKEYCNCWEMFRKCCGAGQATATGGC